MDTSAISKEAKGNSEHVLRELQKCQAQAIQLGWTHSANRSLPEETAATHLARPEPGFQPL